MSAKVEDVFWTLLAAAGGGLVIGIVTAEVLAGMGYGA